MPSRARDTAAFASVAPLALFDSDHPAPIAWRDGQPIDRARFAAEAEAVATGLIGSPWVVNLCEDRYHFLLGFAAAVASGSVTLLPPSRAAQVVDEVARRYERALCFDDAFVQRQLAHAPQTGLAHAAPSPQTLVAIGFTSGSTGQPQPHAKHWEGFCAVSRLNAELVIDRLRARGHAGAPHLVATVPPQHMYGMETSVLLPLMRGFAVHSGRPLFPADVAAALAEVPEPRVLVSTPVHLRALVDSGARFPPVALVLSATAPLDAQLAAATERALDTEVREMFGATETCVIAHRRTACEQAWTLYAGVDLAPSPDGTRVDLPWFAEATELQDVVELLDDRRFVLRGRNLDLIEIAGKRASLFDLTRRLLAQPGVLDAVVFQPDGEAAVRRVAALVVAPGRTAEQISEGLRTAIDPAFLPRPLLCVAALPRNEVGKLTRAQLLAALAAV